MEEINLNFLAILVGVVANIVVGFLWYGPLFGKAWAKEVGVDINKKPATSAMIKSMGLMILGAFLMAWCLAHNVWVWHYFAASQPEVAPPYWMGFSAGFFTWLGFFVPILFNQVGFENKSWKLFGINAGYYFVNLQVLGMILSYWR